MTTRRLTHWRSLGTAGTIAFSRAALAILAAASCLAPQAEGRVFTFVSYKELLNRSDMVVIATPGRTRDTNEPCDLRLPLKCTGVETVFDVSAVFKGDKDIRTFTLHHYREVNEVNASGEPMGLINGPAFVHFEAGAGSYLLFLVRESDARYAPTTGQMDLDIGAVGRLPYSDPFVRPR